MTWSISISGHGGPADKVKKAAESAVKVIEQNGLTVGGASVGGTEGTESFQEQLRPATLGDGIGPGDDNLDA